MLTIGQRVLFRSAFSRLLGDVVVTVVRDLGWDYSDEEAYQVRDETGARFNAFRSELTAL